MAIVSAAGEHVPKYCTHPPTGTGFALFTGSHAQHSSAGKSEKLNYGGQAEHDFADKIIQTHGATKGLIVSLKVFSRNAVQYGGSGGSLGCAIGSPDAILVEPGYPAVADKNKAVGKRSGGAANVYARGALARSLVGFPGGGYAALDCGRVQEGLNQLLVYIAAKQTNSYVIALGNYGGELQARNLEQENVHGATDIGVDGLLAKVVLADEGLGCSGRFVVQAGLFKKTQSSRIHSGEIMRIGRAAQNWDILCPSEQEYEKFFEILKQKQAQYDGLMKVYYYPFDVIEELKYRLEHPSASLLVIPNGKAKLIGPLPFICGDLRQHSLAEIWQRYQDAWKQPQVIDFTKKVIEDTELLKEANKWVQL